MQAAIHRHRLSLCCHVETDNLHADMSQNLDLFDTSNFEQGHPCTRCKTTEYWENSKVRRDRKHRQILWDCGRKCSLNVPNQKKQSKIRAKGIKRSYVKKHVRHQQFLDVLKTQKSIQSHSRTFRSKNHTLQTVEISKTCLCLLYTSDAADE